MEALIALIGSVAITFFVGSKELLRWLYLIISFLVIDNLFRAMIWAGWLDNLTIFIWWLQSIFWWKIANEITIVFLTTILQLLMIVKLIGVLIPSFQMFFYRMPEEEQPRALWGGPELPSPNSQHYIDAHVVTPKPKRGRRNSRYYPRPY